MTTLNNSIVNQVQIELQNGIPFDYGEPLKPYNDNISFDEKFELTYQALRRAIRFKNKLLSMVNAFHLGKLLSETESSTTRFRYKRKLTSHYSRIAENVYDVFEPVPTAIYHVTSLNVQNIREITRPNILRLREIIGGIVITSDFTSLAGGSEN